MRAAHTGSAAGGASAEITLRSPAWLLRGLASIPGELGLRRNAVSFTAQGTGSAWHREIDALGRIAADPAFADKVKDRGRAVLFDAPLADIRAHTPWYWFSGGIVIEVHGQVWKVSFGPPANAAEGLENLRNFGVMREAGRRWRAALGQAD